MPDERIAEVTAVISLKITKIERTVESSLIGSSDCPGIVNIRKASKLTVYTIANNSLNALSGKRVEVNCNR
ncbi:MAG: hypothetical protein HC886_10790 [Leptolyngbyaceae cyanobacterium SM1_1_3]|nr:hypothetical protein [Leptolyngbyaceae cyanobacterium SM1_1_3]